MEIATNIRLNQRKRVAGFTLAEVVLAVAVVAFGLIAVLGVLPVGLNTTRDNRDETIIIQDVEFWMNGMRGGRLSMDALNNVEWVEVTVTHSDDSNKTYRADYATVMNDSSVFEFDGMVPVFPNGEEGAREEYVGILKQASWRADVLGWLSIPESNGTGTGAVTYFKRAKIRPLGATLMNQVRGAKDEEGVYVHDGGDLTFSYLLESRIVKVAENFWKIELKASWPIIEEKVNPQTKKLEVKTGPGKRTFVGHISAPLTMAWSQADVGMLPEVYEEAEFRQPGFPPEPITFYLSPGFVFNSVPPGEKLGRDELVDYLISRLFSNVLKVGQPTSGNFYLDNTNTKANALQNFLSANGYERTDTVGDMEEDLALLEEHADFLKDLNILLHMHGITLKPANGNTQSSGSGGFLSGLSESADALGGIKNSLGLPGGNVDDIMAGLDQLEGANRAEDELFGGAGVDMDGLMGNPLMAILLQLFSNPNSPGVAQIFTSIEDSLKGNQDMLGQLGNMGKQLENMEQIRRNQGIGLSLEQLLSNRKNRMDQIEGAKNTITSITGGAIDIEDLRNKLKELEEDVKLQNNLNALLIKHGLPNPYVSGNDHMLDVLMAALDLKGQIISFLISPLLNSALDALNPRPPLGPYLRIMNLNGNIYCMQAEAHDSLGRYSMMHFPRSLDEYLEYNNDAFPLTDKEVGIWENCANQVIEGNKFDFEKIIKEESVWEIRKFLWDIRADFNAKLLDDSFPGEKLKGWGDYFREMYFFKPLIKDPG
ncbi:MAG: hypothetical protein VYD34_06250 [Verrucomicrobiota bacterium]|nr:hypothetical protein [Verrucomicrobiota bacterium]